MAAECRRYGGTSRAGRAVGGGGVAQRVRLLAVSDLSERFSDS